MSSTPAPTATRRLVYERDEHGSPYAIEIVEVPRWEARLLEPPPPAEADARIVRLAAGRAPAELPRWLTVVRAPTRRTRPDVATGVAEEPQGYDSGEPATEADRDADRVGASIWPWSPSYRGPGASLAEFLAAAAAALRHPGPAPTETERRRALLATFVAERASPFRELGKLRGDALERWLRVHFVEPDRLADALLLERIDDDGATEVGAALRFLADAVVPSSAAEYAELAIDRRVLLEQASPWRYFEGVPLQGALSAVQAWRRRYRIAYDAHYRGISALAVELRRELRGTEQAARALERLDGIAALGPPVGVEARAAFTAATGALQELAAEPDPDLARTGGVTLGVEPPPFAGARHAADEIRRALEVQRRRLASSAVRAVLARPGVPALDRLLQAIAASDLGGLERVLDEPLAAHIEGLLTADQPSVLAALGSRHPVVTRETAEAATATFAELLDAALAASHGGQVALREDVLREEPP